jgi:hypothetical protein
VTGYSAVAIPNLYTALQRSKQKRSMSTVCHLARAIDAYAEKQGQYPRPGYIGPVSAIAPLLGTNVPPVVDGWNHPVLYHATAHHYALRATGRDGVNDGKMYGMELSLDTDIVLADGQFLRVPTYICGDLGRGDDWDTKKYGKCSGCHPARVRPSWQNAPHGNREADHAR